MTSIKILYIFLYAMGFLGTNSLWSQIRVHISTYPDSAKVIVAGEQKSITPGQFYQSKKKSETLTFELVKPGYKVGKIELPPDSKEYLLLRQIFLVPDYRFEIDENAPLVDFDKMVVDFPEGKVIGKLKVRNDSREFRWEGSVRVGDERFAQKAYDVLQQASFKTPYGENAQLFSDQSKNTKPTRFVVGAKLLDLWIEYEYEPRDFATCPNKYTVRSMVDWQIFDKANKKVVLTRKTKGNYCVAFPNTTDGSLVIDAFQLSFQEFLMGGEFAKLVNDAAGKSLTAGKGEAKQAVQNIPKVKTLEFANSSEMISATTKGCVTVETDEGHGSGFIIGANGLILTAYHVVSAANRITVLLPNDLKFDAEVVGFDESHDAALLKIPGSGYAALPIVESKSITPGSDVFTIGTPYEIELGQSVSKGIMSGKRKVEEIVYIQTDVSVSPGNSGGPLINSKGECVGIIQRKLVAAGVEGVGFALPIETALKELGITMEGN